MRRRVWRFQARGFVHRQLQARERWQGVGTVVVLIGGRGQAPANRARAGNGTWLTGEEKGQGVQGMWQGVENKGGEEARGRV